MAKLGRVRLAQLVLTSMVTHHATALPLPKWAIKKVDKYRRNFIWVGKDRDTNTGGHYLVNWKMVQRPKKLGGLGVLDLEKFGIALRERWLWYSWAQDDKQWKGLQLLCSAKDKQLSMSSQRSQSETAKRQSSGKTDGWVTPP